MQTPTPQIVRPSWTKEELEQLFHSIYARQKKAEQKGKYAPASPRMVTTFTALSRKHAEYTRTFEKAIAKMADRWDIETLLPDLDALICKVTADGCTPEDAQVAFIAFCVLINYHRLQKNSTNEGALLEQYTPYFGKQIKPDLYEHVYFFHLRLLYNMGIAIGKSDQFLIDLLHDAQLNSRQMKENYGGHHAFAETVALVFENASPSIYEKLPKTKQYWLDEAKNSAIVAIDRDKGYAKFYCTYGRVLALCGKLDDAVEKVNTAIDKEKNTRKDYSIRITQYTGYLQQFRAQKMMADQSAAMDEQVSKVTKQIEEQEKQSMVKNMEFLGLFSGIVSFTIGSLTITGAIASQSIQSAAGLIVVLLGALMCVFASFGVILHGFKNRAFWRNIFVFALGVAIVGGGLWFCLM